MGIKYEAKGVWHNRDFSHQRCDWYAVKWFEASRREIEYGMDEQLEYEEGGVG